MPIKSRIVGMGRSTTQVSTEVGTVTASLTAAGTNQATAAELPVDDNVIVSTVASGTGVIFPAGKFAQGDVVRIANYGANALKLYPASGGQISNAATNAPLSIAVNTQANLFSIDGISWGALTPGTGGGGGSGTVTSVGLVLPGEFSVSGSPVTVSGNLTGAWATQSANRIFAGPTSGGAATPAFRALVQADLPAQPISITFVIDGGGFSITTGVKGDLVIPFACTISEWTLLADQSGSIVVNVWKDSYTNYPPTVADKITASAPPTISAADKAQSSTLTGWTTSISANDTLRFNVDSASTITRVTLSLKVART